MQSRLGLGVRAAGSEAALVAAATVSIAFERWDGAVQPSVLVNCCTEADSRAPKLPWFKRAAGLRRIP